MIAKKFYKKAEEDASVMKYLLMILTIIIIAIILYLSIGRIGNAFIPK